MGNCSGNLEGNWKRDPFLEVENILQDYAWNELVGLPRWRRHFCRGQYELQVNWARIERQDKVISFRCRRQDATADSDNKAIRRNLCLFKTQFTNNTAVDQTYTFKTEQKTVSSCSFSLQKGFQIGGKLDVSFAIPCPGAAQIQNLITDQKIDPVNVTGGLSGQLSLTKTEGKAFQEELLWSVDSQVKVKPNSTTTAVLNVIEEEVVADFTIETSFKAVHPGANIYLKRKRDNVTEEILEIPTEIFDKVFTRINPERFSFDAPTSLVKCTTEGMCRVIYGAQQIIDINEDQVPKNTDSSVTETALLSVAKSIDKK